MNYDISIVYQDADLLVINKPAGLLTHPKSLADQSASVAGWIRENYPSIVTVGDDTALRPGIVHRLDRETSGLLIITKTSTAFAYMKKQFQERKVRKTYLALVHGTPKNQSGTIDLPLGKIGIRQSTNVHGRTELDAKEAITEYKILKKFTGYALLEAKPLTGRTNQIRVHLKAIGHPIVCDPIYAGQQAVCPPELGRLFLHAQKLAFTSLSGQALALETDLPPKLENFLKTLKSLE